LHWRFQVPLAVLERRRTVAFGIQETNEKGKAIQLPAELPPPTPLPAEAVQV